MNVIASITGRMESAVLLGHLLSTGYEPTAVTPVDSDDERVRQALASGRDLAATCGVAHHSVDLTSVARQLGGSVPPFISIAAVLFYAISRGVNVVAVDYSADCGVTELMLRTIADAASESAEIFLLRPLIHMSSADVVRTGYRLGIPFEITRNCTEESALACGRCSACLTRLKAFKHQGRVDPAPYEGALQ